MQFDPNGVFSFRPDGESRKTRFELNFDDIRQFGFLWFLEKPTQNSGMKPTSWISIPRVIFCFALDGESRKTRFELNFDNIRQFGFLRCLEKPTQNSGMKPTSFNSIPTVFFRFVPMGKVEKRVLNSILTIFVNSAFCAAWKSPPKIVV